MRFLGIIGGLLLVAIVATAVSLLSREATHDRAWVSGQTLLPVVTFDGDHVEVENVRNLSVTGDVGERRYGNRQYDVTALTSVWYGISHFSKFDGLAHTFLSFGFADGSYLALSIEARREVGEAFSPVKGLFRKYELIYVLADERDVIGDRTHIRGERVQLYHLDLDFEQRRGLFVALLREAQALNSEPRFYNTLTDNCTTGIVKHARQVPAWKRLLDYRIVFPGYSDGLAFDLDLIGDGPLQELRDRATIDPARVDFTADDFSAALRVGLG